MIAGAIDGLVSPMAYVFKFKCSSGALRCGHRTSLVMQHPHLKKGSDPMTSSDESAVRHLLEQVLEAWARGDGSEFAAAFAMDGDVIFFDGSHVHGRKQIATVMEQLFGTLLKGTRCIAEVKTLRFVTPDVALMQTLGGAAYPGETEVPSKRYSIQTFVAVRLQGIWTIASFQNTRVQPLNLSNLSQA